MNDTVKTKPVPVKPQKPSFLGSALPPIVAADNMSGEDLAPMTFNMPRKWHARFKSTAAVNAMSMKELLIESFKAWEAVNTDKQIK